jgi:predicted ATPase
LHAVSPWDEGTLQRGLQQLVEAEFLYQQGLPPQATYLFKHALIQEAAYQSLLRSTRQQYHQRIAQVLEAHFPETTETQPELVAHHYTEAGLREQAVGYWQRAGQRAIERSANLEAVAHLTQGLEVLATLPDTPERAQRELMLQATLGPALMHTKGYAFSDVEEAYGRARELCQQVGDTPQLFPVLWGLWHFHIVRGKLQTAQELAAQLLTLAQRVHDPALLLEAHYAFGMSLFWRGELASAHTHFAQGIALYNPQQHRSHAFRFGQDPGMACLSAMAWIRQLLGYPDEALTRSQEALTLAQQQAHPFSLAFACAWAAFLHQLRRDGPATEVQAEAAIALATEQEFPFWRAIGAILQGWAHAAQGQPEEGIPQMYQGIAAIRAMGEELGRAYFLGLLAEALVHMRQAEEGLTILDEALAAAESTGVRVQEAELYRLKGVLLLLSADHEAEAEACFRQALDIARHQQAKSLELSAATSLCCLWQRQGKRAEAHDLLAPVYGWFTEGFDTADLQEAKALLEELGG